MCIICRNRSISPCLLLLLLIRLIYAESPTANLPTTWRLEDHTYKFRNKSILREILYRGAGRVNFAFGFYCEASCEGVSYSLSILIIQVHLNPGPLVNAYNEQKVVWSANRNHLVSSKAVLKLTDKGDLVLKDPDKKSVVWSAGTSMEPVVGINLTDIGNLVLFDQNNTIVWQSFDHPTDTLLQGQKLMVGKELVSSVNEVNRTEQSRFSLTLTTHGLYAVVSSKTNLCYYSLNTQLLVNGYITMVNGALGLFLNGSASGEVKKVISTIPGVLSPSYIRLGNDGHLRAYGYDNYGWAVMMGELLPLETCRYPTVCDPYGICSNGQCICPPSRYGVIYFNPVSLTRPELGCSPVVPLTCEDSQNHTFLEVKGVTYFYFSFDILDVDANGCIDACAMNCSCKTAFFKQFPNNPSGVYFLPSELFSMINVDDVSFQLHNYTVYLKIQNRKDDAGSANRTPITKGKETFLQKRKGVRLGVVIAFAILSLAALLFAWRKMNSDKETEDDHVEEVPGMPARFSYADLKSITDDFSQKLGEGGFGAVFRGTLHDGTKIAVKCLYGSRHMKKSFLNEAGTIGSIHHISLVKLLGFCAEKSHRLLEQCKQKIVQVDIKPQNILLDDNLRGKVSDFGLSKLVDRENDRVVTTVVRRTPGYLAPEWLNGMITEKVDVYCFGVVILEIILGRRVVGTRQYLEDTDMLKLFDRKAEEGRLMDLIEACKTDLKLDQSDWMAWSHGG